MRRIVIIAIALMSTAAAAQGPQAAPAQAPTLDPQGIMDQTTGALYRQNIMLQAQVQQAMRQIEELKKQLPAAKPAEPAPETPKP